MNGNCETHRGHRSPPFLHFFGGVVSGLIRKALVIDFLHWFWFRTQTRESNPVDSLCPTSWCLMMHNRFLWSQAWIHGSQSRDFDSWSFNLQIWIVTTVYVFLFNHNHMQVEMERCVALSCIVFMFMFSLWAGSFPICLALFEAKVGPRIGECFHRDTSHLQGWAS